MTLAVVPAFALVVVSLFVFVAGVRRWRRHLGTAQDLVVSLIFLALAANALVAGLGLIKFITEQDTITFWAALTRTVAIIGGSYIAYHWWVDADGKG
jgi:hypothetical protein